MSMSKRRALSHNRVGNNNEEEPTFPDWINNLNNDCLVTIFKHLPMHQRLTIETVCKRWKEVAELAWEDIKALNFSYSSEENDISRLPTTFQSIQCIGNILMKCGNHLKELKLGYPYDSSLLPIIGQHCCNLTRLVIDLKRYDEKCVKLLPQMEKLTYLEMKKLTRWVPKDFFQTLSLETLTELHLWGWVKTVQLPHEFLSALQSFQKLKALTLNLFSMEYEVAEVISQKASLVFLSLINCDINGEMPQVNLLTNLEHLHLESFKLDNYFLFQLSENNKNLRYLNISKSLYGCFNDYGLATLKKLSQLEELIVSNMDSITDQSLSIMHNLKKLECQDCHHVYDQGIIELIIYAPNLEYLNLAGCEVSQRVLTEASEITKRRTNNLKLQVVVSYRVQRFWDADEHHSPLLTVEARMWPFDGDDDADDFFLGYDEEIQDMNDQYQDYNYHNEEECDEDWWSE